MHNQIGYFVLGSLSAVFGGYGVLELTLAYKAEAWEAWCKRAVAGTAGIFVAAVFAAMTLQVSRLGSNRGLQNDEWTIQRSPLHDIGNHNPSGRGYYPFGCLFELEDARAPLIMVDGGKLPTPVLTLADALGATPAVNDDRVPVRGVSVDRDHP
jgi:hypothetical protein